MTHNYSAEFAGRPPEIVTRICDTMDRVDPEHTAVVVGGAAIVMQLARAGVSPDAAVTRGMDIDCLGSDGHLRYLLHSGRRIAGVEHVGGRWWSDGVSDRRAFAVDIMPRDRRLLPVTVCNEMVGARPISWRNAAEAEITECFGIRCLGVTEVLSWKAMTGRPKDIDKVMRVLPLAREAGLVSPRDAEYILDWLAVSRRRLALYMAARPTKRLVGIY